MPSVLPCVNWKEPDISCAIRDAIKVGGSQIPSMSSMNSPSQICVMMKELGLYDLTPALCHLDYTMSEAGGVTNFVRQYTLASGGPYCDCGYKKKTNK